MTESSDGGDGGIGRRRALRAGIGALTVGVVGQALAGTATAHFPDRLDVDVAPGSDRNVVVANRGFVPVLVRTTTFEDDGETVVFDPTERPVRYRFGASGVVGDGEGARPVHDGHPFGDCLLLLFPAEDTGIDADTTDVRLEWERSESGEHGLSGTDEVTVLDGRYAGGAHGDD